MSSKKCRSKLKTWRGAVECAKEPRHPGYHQSHEYLGEGQGKPVENGGIAQVTYLWERR
jgi:hypothetical protein